jgi:hypothetical protein
VGQQIRRALEEYEEAMLVSKDPNGGTGGKTFTVKPHRYQDNLYGKLGVLPITDATDVVAAAEWRKKKFPEETFEEKYKQLDEAENNLADGGKRIVYDQPCMKLFNLCAKKQPDGSFLIQPDEGDDE